VVNSKIKCGGKQAFLYGLYVATTYFIMTFVIKCYDCEIGIELEVGWLEVKLIRVLEILCGRCYTRREPGL